MNEQFYTLDEEKRELVANPISVGDGLTVLMQISKKYLTRNPADADKKVNIKLGEISEITYQMQRKTTADYIPGRKDPHAFSRGHILGNGRMICPVLDRELITFIFKELQQNAPDSKMFDFTESDFTFGSPFEVEEASKEAITDDKNGLVGGTNPIFRRNREYIYLDDIPVFDLRVLATADGVRNVTELGDTSVEGREELMTGIIYELKLNKLKFLSDSTGADAVNPIKNQITDFLILGTASGWRKLK